MGKIYANQSAFRLKLNCFTDASLATTKKIFYIKPDGTEGSWDALELAPTYIYKDMTFDEQEGTEIDQSGKWLFWAELTFADDRWVPGDVQFLMVYEKGKMNV